MTEIGERIVVLTIDFDYWHLGLNIRETLHCGRCKPQTKRPTEPDTRFPKPEVTTSEVVALVQPGTPIYASECHADLVAVLNETKALNPGKPIDVYSIDAHNDS